MSEIRVTFFATGESHRPVPTIAKSDFAVVDNEWVVRNFRSFTRSDEYALNVVVLVDLSESVAPRFRASINDVLQLVAREQSIPDDDIAVLSFGGMLRTEPAILCWDGCRAPDSIARLRANQELRHYTSIRRAGIRIRFCLAARPRHNAPSTHPFLGRKRHQQPAYRGRRLPVSTEQRGHGLFSRHRAALRCFLG